MISVYKKELRSFFNNMTGYIYIAFLLLITGIYTYATNLANSSPYFELVLPSISFIFLITTPILTMRVLSEERHQKTDRLLYSLPLKVTQIVFGKYLAMLTVLLIPTLIMTLYPIILSFYGEVNFAGTYLTLLGFFLFAASMIAIGMFMSALTESQIIAAVSSFGVLLLCYLMGSLASLVPVTSIASFIAFTVCVVIVAVIVYLMMKSFLAAAAVAAVGETAIAVIFFTSPTLFEGAFAKFLSYLSIYDRFTGFFNTSAYSYYNSTTSSYNSVFDLTAVVYFVSFSLLFVFFTVQAVEKRRWS